MPTTIEKLQKTLTIEKVTRNEDELLVQHREYDGIARFTEIEKELIGESKITPLWSDGRIVCYKYDNSSKFTFSK